MQTGAGQVLKLAIMAVGGQGGGVLTNWITDMARGQGWHVQATAVAGVAQRTGATIYYIEMAEGPRAPVFALAPAAGDVDLLVAAEWAEAGRAVMRGFVTPDRTTLIASTHRALAVSEKIVPGDGRLAGPEIGMALEASAARVIAFDMQTPAVAAGSVISATLFGALAGSGALPFAVDRFRDTVRASGRGVEAGLRAFEAGLAGPVDAPPTEPEAVRPETHPTGPSDLVSAYAALVGRVDALPEEARGIARRGLEKVVDFQDPAYGAAYLDRLERIVDLGDDRLTGTVAKYLANAMAYDDVIRVADLKTRPDRSRRIAAEMGGDPAAMHVTEFMHPRIEELTATLPLKWGRWLQARPRLSAWLDRRINRGRHVRTDTVLGFGQLWLVAGLKRWRRGSLRHAEEMAHVEAWLDLVAETAARDPALAVEIAATRRLIKGYSDTHARGQSKYDRVLGSLPLLEGRADAADWLRRLREAALQDADGAALEGALKTVKSFAVPQAAE